MAKAEWLCVGICCVSLFLQVERKIGSVLALRFVYQPQYYRMQNTFIRCCLLEAYKI